MPVAPSWICLILHAHSRRFPSLVTEYYIQRIRSNVFFFKMFFSRFSFLVFLFSSFNYDFFFLLISFFFFSFFFLSPVTPQVKRRIRTESWPENCGFGGCVRVLLATLLSAATPKLLWPVIMRRRERQLLLHADIFTIFSRINVLYCSYHIIEKLAAIINRLL